MLHARCALQAAERLECCYHQTWPFFPSILQGCHCLPGFKANWSADGTVLRCVVDSTSALPPWMWVLVALGGVLLLMAGALLVLGSKWALFRVRWLREVELKRKHALGMPKEGSAVSVVITDIEGYSSERPRGEGWGGWTAGA